MDVFSDTNQTRTDTAIERINESGLYLLVVVRLCFVHVGYSFAWRSRHECSSIHERSVQLCWHTLAYLSVNPHTPIRRLSAKWVKLIPATIQQPIGISERPSCSGIRASFSVFLSLKRTTTAATASICIWTFVGLRLIYVVYVVLVLVSRGFVNALLQSCAKTLKFNKMNEEMSVPFLSR